MPETTTAPALPPAPLTLVESGLSPTMITELALKTLTFHGSLSTKQLIQRLKIRRPVLFPVLQEAKARKLCLVEGSPSTFELSWVWGLTELGRQYVAQVMERDQYLGPLPVPLEQYCAMVERQSTRGRHITRAMIGDALNDLVVDERVIEQLGPACNAGQSLFLYGHPGNGKTLLSKRLSQLAKDPIVIPYAIEADGQIIRLYNQSVHEAVVEDATDEEPVDASRGADERWIVIRRPFVQAGGELMLDQLDIQFDPKLKFYLAPLQLMANGGTFLIDDFGRQRVAPQEILNRWIVPLESRVDFFTLASGRQITVPFDVFLMLSTNLAPHDLVDEAFLRRIRYKVEVRDPTEDEFREIFRRQCVTRKLKFDEAAVSYLINYHYFDSGRELRACHPRDLVDQMMELISFRKDEPALTYELVDAACRSYFIES